MSLPLCCIACGSVCVCVFFFIDHSLVSVGRLLIVMLFLFSVRLISNVNLRALHAQSVQHDTKQDCEEVKKSKQARSAVNAAVGGVPRHNAGDSTPKDSLLTAL